MNYQFDVIVIGDSKEGNTAVKNIASKNRKIKIAFISCEFKNTTTRDFLNVEYIKSQVIFTSYNNRLFCCYLDNGDRYYCTHLIVASGISYAPFTLKNKPVPGVFNTINEIPRASKQLVAIVICNDDADAKLALAVAKKYKYVYLCIKSLKLAATEATIKKLNNAENILSLPNTSIAKVKLKDGLLESVCLDNYTEITCNNIFVKTSATPETDFISDKIIAKENGYLKTTNDSQSLLVPKCFAIGSCAIKSTKKAQEAMIETILNDLKGV